MYFHNNMICLGHGEYDILKICDFGLARESEDSEDVTNAKVGTR